MRMTRSNFVKLMTAAAISVAIPSVAFSESAKKYVFVTGGDFAPYDMTNPDGTLYGFEIDLLKELAKRGKFDYELRQMAWDGMMQSLMDGKFDAIIYSVTITDERLKVVDFSLPYTSEASSFAVEKDGGISISTSDAKVNIDEEAGKSFIETKVVPALKGKTVGAEAGSTQLSFVKQFLEPNGVEIRQYVGLPQAYQDLASGRLDAVVAAETSLADFVDKNKDTAEVTGPGYVGGTLGFGPGIVVRKGDAALLSPINEGLKQMTADGSLSELTKKWFGRDLSPTR